MTHIFQAKKYAATMVAELLPHCKIIDIAGSVIRSVLEVKDIEICCIPKTITISSNSLFDEPTSNTIIDPAFGKAVANLGKIVKGKYDGRYMKIESRFNINLDLFMPADYDYYRQLAIRTGSADYSYKVIAVGWRKMGWCGTENGLRMMIDCEPVYNKDNKQVGWKCIRENAHVPPVWKSEKEFFDWLNIPYKEPRFRNF